MGNYKTIWSKQSDSAHRGDMDDFYSKKSIEHSQILGKDANLPAVDLGCGAGELLEFLIKTTNIHEAIDYSDKMLETAKERLSESKILFSNKDVFSYLKECSLPVWMACGSINQYLASKDQIEILDLFVNNSNAKSIYWFDTVCPSRYILWRGVRILNFRPNDKIKLNYLKQIYGFFIGLLNAIFLPGNLQEKELGGMMGYAFSPSLFINEAKKRHLSIEIINSKYYEYRYHVIIKKHG